MPTVTVATNVVVDAKSLPTLIQSMGDVLAPLAEVPKEYVHIHVMHSQFMSFGGDPLTPCCQVSVMTCEGQLTLEIRNKVAAALQPHLEAAVAGLTAGRTQVVFPTLAMNQIAIGGTLLSTQ